MSSLQFELIENPALYAEANIVESVTVDSNGQCIRAFQKSLRLFSITIAVFWVAAAQLSAKVDLNLYCLFSIEWLVDESDVIVVARFPNDQNEFLATDGTVPSKPEFLRTIKGNADDLTWPFVLAKDSNPHLNSYKYLSPDSGGQIRLLFIRGKSELLQLVRLGRHRTNEPSIKYFGVTQYGAMLQSESSLYRAIEQRLQGDRKPIANSIHEVDVPHDFLLQSHSEYYSLRVPADQDRRDHFIQLLESGDAAEKIYAINALANLSDLRGYAAIREALNCRNATPVFNGLVDRTNPSEWNAESVREAAAKAIDLMDKKPKVGELK